MKRPIIASGRSCHPILWAVKVESIADRRPLAVAPRNMAGCRNSLVHGDDTVDLAIMRDMVEQHLDKLLGFVSAVRTRLG